MTALSVLMAITFFANAQSSIAEMVKDWERAKA